MSKARKLRRARRWARYVNHYGHIPGVIIGGWAATRLMNIPGPWWPIIRRQDRIAWGRGYAISFDEDGRQFIR